MSRSPVAALLAVLLLASLSVSSSAQEAPPADAVCMGFVGNTMSLDTPRPNQVEVSTQRMAPEVEAWMEAQLAEGRARFVATPVFANGSVLCAW